MQQRGNIPTFWLYFQLLHAKLKLQARLKIITTITRTRKIWNLFVLFLHNNIQSNTCNQCINFYMNKKKGQDFFSKTTLPDLECSTNLVLVGLHLLKPFLGHDKQFWQLACNVSHISPFSGIRIHAESSNLLEKRNYSQICTKSSADLVRNFQPTLSEAVQVEILSASLARRKSLRVGNIVQSNLFQKFNC